MFSFIFGAMIIVIFFILFSLALAYIYYTKDNPEDSKNLIIQSLQSPNKKTIALRSELNDLNILKDAADYSRVSIHFISNNPTAKEINEAFQTFPFIYLDFQSTNEEHWDLVCSNLKNLTSTFFGRYWEDKSVPMFLSRCSRNVENIFIPNPFSFFMRIIILLVTSLIFLLGSSFILLMYVRYVIFVNSGNGVDYYVKKYNETMNHMELDFDPKKKQLKFITKNSGELSQQMNEVYGEEFHDQI
jgi:ABC-type multidrug transport system fused ATPase/permease subunit